MTKTVRWDGPWTAIPAELLRDESLSRNARLTMAVLLTYAIQSEECFPGQERLAAQLGAESVRSVQRWIAELEEAGRLTVIRVGQNRPNRYVLHPERDTRVGPPGGHDSPVASDTTPVSPPDTTLLSPEVDEVEEDEEKKMKKTSDVFDADVVRLAEKLAEKSNARTESKRFKPTKAWLTEMDRLIRLDGRTPEQIEYVIGWIDRPGNFWGPNVLSAPKLREKFDTLVAQIRRERDNGGGGRAKGAGRGARVDARVRELLAEPEGTIETHSEEVR